MELMELAEMVMSVAMSVAMSVIMSVAMPGCRIRRRGGEEGSGQGRQHFPLARGRRTRMGGGETQRNTATQGRVKRTVLRCKLLPNDIAGFLGRVTIL